MAGLIADDVEMDAADALGLLASTPPLWVSEQLPVWLRTGPVQPNFLDPFSTCQSLILVALASARTEDLEAITADQVLTYGRTACRMGQDRHQSLYQAAGTLVFAGRLAAEAVRLTCQEHSDTRDDAVLADLLTAVVARSWPSGSPREPDGDPRPGLRLYRHIEARELSREVGTPLEDMARLAMVPAAQYAAGVRRLASAVLQEHARHHHSPAPVLAQALRSVLEAADGGRAVFDSSTEENR
ncbi:hypothetical protein OG723_44565 (plasmid) [Streptomyces sp. NBC_01278]|uniref:hypothetical protein n=1 Tax=Streptomyces sp. NBC_01278 TaxID=2903809 RepID=UPI002E3228DC|nr:hypothetical protein [Streptomyces sp. NBC_01278]